MIDQQKEQLNYTYSVIDRYEKVINNFEKKNLFQEWEVLKDKQDIRILKNTKLSNNKILKVYHLTKGFRYGINSFTSGSGYIDFHNNNLLVLSSRGILAFSKNIDDENNLHQRIEYTLCELWDYVAEEKYLEIFFGKKRFIFYPQDLQLMMHQTWTWRNQGISKINMTNIYDVSLRADVVLHIHITGIL